MTMTTITIESFLMFGTAGEYGYIASCGDRFFVETIQGPEAAVMGVLMIPRDVSRTPTASAGKCLVNHGRGVQIDAQIDSSCLRIWVGCDWSISYEHAVACPPLVADAISAEIMAAIARDALPAHVQVPIPPAVCPDCKGTKIYVGAAFYPTEPCRTCCGASASAPVAAVDDDELPEGLAWREIDTTHYFRHCIVDSMGFVLLLYKGDGTVDGDQRLRTRPDAANLSALLRRKNGLT